MTSTVSPQLLWLRTSHRILWLQLVTSCVWLILHALCTTAVATAECVYWSCGDCIYVHCLFPYDNNLDKFEDECPETWLRFTTSGICHWPFQGSYHIYIPVFMYVKFLYVFHVLRFQAVIYICSPSLLYLWTFPFVGCCSLYMLYHLHDLHFTLLKNLLRIQ